MATFTSLICGYIRFEIETQHRSLPVIPSEIITLCCQYVGDFMEHFAVKGDAIKIVSKYKQPTATLIGGTSAQCLYGSIIIPSTKYSDFEWTFKLHHITGSLAVGIVDCAEPLLPNDSILSHQYNRYYAWHLDQRRRNIQQGDVIKMRLDLFPKERELQFYRGDECVRRMSVQTHDDVKYRLVVCLEGRMDCIQLIKFEKDLFEFDHGLDWMTLF